MYSIGSNQYLVLSDHFEQRGEDLYMPKFPGYWQGMLVVEAHTANRYIVVNDDGKLEKIDE